MTWGRNGRNRWSCNWSLSAISVHPASACTPLAMRTFKFCFSVPIQVLLQRLSFCWKILCFLSYLQAGCKYPITLSFMHCWEAFIFKPVKSAYELLSSHRSLRLRWPLERNAYLGDRARNHMVAGYALPGLSCYAPQLPPEAALNVCEHIFSLLLYGGFCLVGPSKLRWRPCSWIWNSSEPSDITHVL